MSERVQNLGFALAWVVTTVFALYCIPHAKIATYLNSLFFAKDETTLLLALYLGTHVMVLTLLWYAARSFHLYIRDYTDSYLAEDGRGLADRLTLGLIWGLTTAITVSLLIGLCASGKKGTLRQYIFDLARGEFDSKILLAFGILALVLAFPLMANRNTWTIFRQEIRRYFSTPIVYVLLMLFTLLAGYFFQGSYATFDQYQSFYQMRYRAAPQFNLNDVVLMRSLNTYGFLLLFMTPILTMRLIAEEKKNRTYELLMTGPLTTLEIVLGKFLSVMAVLGTMLALTFVFPMLLNGASPGAFEWGPVFTAYLGLYLLGGCFVAIGLFCSTLTEDQIISATICFGVLLLLWVIEWASFQMQDGPVRRVVAYMSFISHLKGFIKGVVEVKDVVYFLSLIFFANFLAHRTIESQRWR